MSKQYLKIIAVEEASVIYFEKTTTYTELYIMLHELRELECLNRGQPADKVHCMRARLLATQVVKYRGTLVVGARMHSFLRGPDVWSLTWK